MGREKSKSAISVTMSSVAPQEPPVSDEMLLTSMIVFATRLARDGFHSHLSCLFNMHGKVAIAKMDGDLESTQIVL